MLEEEKFDPNPQNDHIISVLCTTCIILRREYSKWKKVCDPRQTELYLSTLTEFTQPSRDVRNASPCILSLTPTSPHISERIRADGDIFLFFFFFLSISATGSCKRSNRNNRTFPAAVSLHAVLHHRRPALWESTAREQKVETENSVTSDLNMTHLELIARTKMVARPHLLRAGTGPIRKDQE